MAGSNPTPPVVDDDKPVSEDDLRDLKYSNPEVDPPAQPAGDEPGDDDKPDDDAPPDADEPDDQIEPPAPDADEPDGDKPDDDTPPAFVKQFDYIKGDTPEEYAVNLEAAYANSTTEAVRLKKELDEQLKAPPIAPAKPAPETPPTGDPNPPATVKSPTDLYVSQKLDQEVAEAFEVIKQDYPQSSDPTEYAKFTKSVAAFSRNILDTEDRLASPSELYNMAAISLKWEKRNDAPDDKDKLGMAVKNGAATNKPTSASPKPKPAGPKISEAQMKLNRQMYPGKTDAEIIEELTPFQ